ncbi:uncharacterized protein LOC113799282 [Dermatophagoides pteronyssinus]|uniref:uncharacterized protein LOC113799282 n=1 Tax=Dermatophagoides pteronyssinus TaxID=6956 RepID=UPI003F66E27A
MYLTSSFRPYLFIATSVLSQIYLSLGQAQQQCPGYRPEEVSYPTPYITPQDRSSRCKTLFSRFNSTGTANLSFIGQNTYHNPCKIECGLCVDDELPDEKEEINAIRSYPPHISLKDSIVKCNDEVEIFEQFMESGTRCGPFHYCEDNCCKAKPELFPNSKRAKQRTKSTDINRFSQDMPPEWTKPLICEEEGYFRNPNDCHKFYRCHKTGTRGGFSRTLFECNPSTLIFDEQYNVCVAVEENINDNVCDQLDANAEVDY